METSSDIVEEFEETKAEKTKVRLDSVLSVSPVVILVFSRINQILYASRSAAIAFDARQEDLIGKTWKELGWPSEIGEALEKESELVFQSGHSVRSETKFFTKRGWWNVKYDVSPVKDKRGNVKMVVVTVSDGNQQKKLEEALSRFEDKYRSLVELSSDGIVLVDEDANIAEWNHGMETITGLKKEEAVGKPIYEIQMLLSEEQTQENSEAIRSKSFAAIQTGEGPPLNRTTETVIRRRSDGARIWVQQTAFPIETGKGFKVGSFLRDITLQRRREELDRALGRILADLVSSLELDKVMNSALSAAREAVGCDSVVVAVKEADRWILKYGSGIPLEAIGTSIFVTLDAAYAFITSGRALVVDDTEFDNRIDPSIIRRFGIKSQMSMPISMGGKMLGALVFIHSKQAHAYSEDEIKFATNLSASLSLAVENIKLFEWEKEERSILQALLDNSPTITLLVDGRTSAIKLGNNTFKRIMEQSGNLEKETSIIELFPTLKEVINTAFHKVAETGEPYKIDEVEFELPILGKRFWNSIAVPIPTKTGTSDIMIVSVDVTELVKSRKRVEDLVAKAEQENARLEAILRTIPVGVLIFDSKGQLQESNEYLKRILFGSLPDTVRNRTNLRRLRAWWADTGIPLREEDWGALRAINKGEVAMGDVLDIERFDGSRGTILSAAAPIWDESGEVMGAVAVVQDITQQRSLEHEAIEARERAELYLDLLTHDIRDLNSSASEYLRALREKCNLEKASELLADKAMKALEESTNLIENVRKLQRIEFHEVKQGAINLTTAIQDAVKSYQDAPGMQATISFAPTNDQIVIANELLNDIFLNIVGNAIKRSANSASIDIQVGKAYENGKEYYKVAIQDNGPGIPDEMKSNLFSRLTRGKTKAAGPGFGLYLVRRLVEDFHGRVWVEDRVQGDYSKGAKFVVMLPVAPR